jgi:hypothetical protein
MNKRGSDLWSLHVIPQLGSPTIPHPYIYFTPSEGLASAFTHMIALTQINQNGLSHQYLKRIPETYVPQRLLWYMTREEAVISRDPTVDNGHHLLHQRQ